MPETPQLLPAYLVVGEDDYKREYAVRRLKQRLGGDKGVSDFNLDERRTITGMEPEDLIESLDTMPFGSDFRLVILWEADKLPKALSEAVVAYLAEPNPDSVLCLVAGSLAKGTRLYKAVNRLGERAVIDCTPMKRWELPAFVRSLAVSHSVTMSQGAAEELVSRIGESTVYLDNEVKALAMLKGEGSEITLTDVERNVARTAEVKPWDLLDAVCERDATKACSLLALMPTTSPVAIHVLLLGRLRELICAKSLAERGESSLLATELKKRPWQVKNHARWARKFTMRELEEALRSGAECERQLKGTGDSETALLVWILSVTNGVPVR